MPYVITTKQTAYDWPSATVEDRRVKNMQLRRGYVSRRAVATLDEARSEVRSIALDHGSMGGAQKAMRLPESGGSVGPLPDGTVIEVERVEWDRLAQDAEGWTIPPAHAEFYPDLIDAYNAAQEGAQA